MKKSIIIPFLFLLILQSCSSLEGYLEKNEFISAAKYCENLKGEEKIKAYQKLASYLIKRGQYDQAVNIHMKLADENNDKKHYNNAGEIYLNRKLFLRAIKFFDMAENVEKIKSSINEYMEWAKKNSREVDHEELNRYAKKYDLKEIFGEIAE